MPNRIRRTHAVALAVFAISAPAAAADPVSINLRVEGQNQTIVDGPVTTDGHHITTPSGGPHPCDGTNNGAHPAPGPTATGALDDGARLNNLTWDGDWFPSFNDFLVTRIADEAETTSQFWYFAVNFKLGGAGGCQTREPAGRPGGGHRLPSSLLASASDSTRAGLTVFPLGAVTWAA